MAVAASRSIHGLRRISTGSVGSASRWLVSFKVAARLPEMSKPGRRVRRRTPPAPRHRRSRPRGRRFRRPPPASRAGGRRSRGRRPARPVRARIPSSAGHGRTAASSCGTARRPCAPVASVGDVLGRPHMVEPAAAVVLRPVGRTIAPPGVEALRRRDGSGGRDRPIRCSACSRVSASTSTGVWLTTLSSCLWLQTSHSSGATLKSPTRMVGTAAGFGPARHPLDEVELLAELGVLGRGRGCRRRRAHRRSPA